jgi:GNAT superfamily N-acetyltransferase
MRTEAVSVEKAQPSYRAEVIPRPAELTAERIEELTQQFSDISWRATGGPDWQSYPPARDGWYGYYCEPGGRPQDYDRLVLVYEGDQLVHFTGLTVFRPDPQDVSFIWVHVAITLPEYQGHGLLRLAIETILDPAWLKGFGRELFFIFRTPNSIVYEAMRNIARGFEADGIRVEAWYPEINQAGEMDAIPDEVRRMAIRVAQRISPECEFRPDIFVIRGYYKRYGPLYKEHSFPCQNPATRAYFQRNLDNSNQDGLFIFIHLVDTGA